MRHGILILSSLCAALSSVFAALPASAQDAPPAVSSSRPPPPPHKPPRPPCRRRRHRYLRFIVEELKPAIDGRFATLPDRDNTLIMGSSMGALNSLYAISKYPQVFGAAGCLSTHWLGGFDNNASIPLALFDYLLRRAAAILRLDDARQRLYRPEYASRVFPGADHGEGSWAERLDVPLTFLGG